MMIEKYISHRFHLVWSVYEANFEIIPFSIKALYNFAVSP
jgi:hypothetical protein